MISPYWYTAVYYICFKSFWIVLLICPECPFTFRACPSGIKMLLITKVRMADKLRWVKPKKNQKRKKEIAYFQLIS